MRFIRNEIQTPKLLVPPEKRKTIFFAMIYLGVVLLITGAIALFAVFYYQELMEARLGIPYRRLQTYTMGVGGTGVILYIIGALFLKLPLRKTTYYKVRTVMRNELFDPPRKKDFTKPIFARLHELNDEWAMFTEVRPKSAGMKIPQTIIGPGGVLTTYAINENPERKRFEDPGPGFYQASKELGSAIGHSVLPIIVFATPKLVSIYRDKCKPKTRVMHIREIEDFLDSKKNVLTTQQREMAEAKIYQLIEGTPPGE
jgi:hypothetical protein